MVAARTTVALLVLALVCTAVSSPKKRPTLSCKRRILASPKSPIASEFITGRSLLSN